MSRYQTRLVELQGDESRPARVGSGGSTIPKMLHMVPELVESLASGGAMTKTKKRPEVPPPDPKASFAWGSPRWREPDGAKDTEPPKRRRFRDTAAPNQPGAIDSGDSLRRDKS
jgi:hypothetical protein